jgi:hypothetical protein
LDDPERNGTLKWISVRRTEGKIIRDGIRNQFF